jgi:putative hydroxymethylpyrimidine transport system permease protein
MKKISDYVGVAVVIIFLFAVWEGGARAYGQPFILPSPSQISYKLWELREVLVLVHLPATLSIIITGLAISVVAGVLLAILMYYSKIAEKTFYPLLVASQTIPVIALAPIFVLWFGYSIWSKVAVTVLFTFFPVTVGMYDGLRSTDRKLAELLQTMGANKRDIFFKVSLPSGLPYFFSSLKVAVTLSVIGAAVGEWLGAQAGLGYFSRRMMTQFDGAAVFAPIVLLALLGIALFVMVKLIESIILKWRH